jgi:uncharacterized protein YecA (UPF0149 family)
VADGSRAGVRSDLVILEAILLWNRTVDGSRGLSMLIQRELKTVIGVELDVDLLSKIESELRRHEEALREQDRRLTEREQAVMRLERLGTLRKRHLAPPTESGKVGRNERCPCGSGLKFKGCHGSA